MTSPTNAAEPPFEAYGGKDPYLFVSYSHKDSALVYPEIERLHQLGFRIWYDEGIDPGNEWPDEVAKALDLSSFFLVFVSPRSVESKNVRNEINFAINHLKPFLAIHVEETPLPKGLELRMGDIQAVLKYRMQPDRYHRQIEKAIPFVLRDGIKIDEPPTIRRVKKLGDIEKQGSLIHTLQKNTQESVEREGADCSIPEKRRELSKLLEREDIVAVACKLFETGLTGLDFAPIEKFGHYVTADPSEAEQARSIQAVLKRHTEAPQNARVLNLALFGPLGSGKTFLVRETARIAGIMPTSDIEIGLPELRDPKDLAQFYRRAQDSALSGKMPMLWFEGFDDRLSGVPLGWIQHLVRTMRDGAFVDDGVRRPLCPCVMCFVATEHVSHALLTHAVHTLRAQGHSTILSNFLSLINCYLDVRGLNPIWPEDRVYMLTRALILRSFLQFERRTITPALLRVLLTVPEYFSNAFSLKKVLDACRPQVEGNLLTKDSLPSDCILNQHLDSRWLRNALKECAV